MFFPIMCCLLSGFIGFFVGWVISFGKGIKQRSNQHLMEQTIKCLRKDNNELGVSSAALRGWCAKYRDEISHHEEANRMLIEKLTKKNEAGKNEAAES